MKRFKLSVRRTAARLRRLACGVAVFSGLHGPALAAADGCGASGVALQVLGSGGPEMRGRASASYLVWVDGKARVLVDVGGGSALRFGESRARMADLDAVLFSHLHSDHSADFPVLIKSSHFESAPRKRALPAFGPPGTPLMPSTSEFMDALFAPKTGVFRYLGAAGNEKTYEIESHDVALGAAETKLIFDRDGLRISATPVIHANIPALAFRVEVQGKSMVFFGDGNGNNGNLEKISGGASLLIAHLAIDDSIHFGERSLHAPPDVIGRIAQQSSAKRLVLAHRRPETLGKETHLKQVIAREYSGPISFADDLDCIAVP